MAYASRLDAVQQLLGLLRSQRHRLVAEDVAAGVGGAERELTVRVGRRRDRDDVQLLRAQKLVEVRVDTLDAEARRDVLRGRAGAAADRDRLGGLVGCVR